MPPRFAYWTILIDGQPTAFRARDQRELLPTFHQLKRTNKDVLLRWFARGRLWESQQQDWDARRQRKGPPGDRRGREWRPGGQHKDPRARFDRKTTKPRDARRSGRKAHRRPGQRTAPGRGPKKPRMATPQAGDPRKKKEQ
jgi:hypothetical protein